MAVTRRAFLAGCTAVLTLPLCGISHLSAAAASGRKLIAGSEKSVCAIDLDTRQVTQVPVAFKPHGYAQNPRQPAHIWAFEKWGRGAAEVDFATASVAQTFASPEDTQFFGHGLFSRDGKICFAVREDLTTGLGHCIGFDTTTYQEVMDIQATPGGLHECHLLDDDTFLVASNGAPVIFKDGVMQSTPMVEHSSLVHVDPWAGKVRDKKFIADDDQIIGHFALSWAGAIIALSSQRRSAAVPHGAIYFGHLNKPALRRVVLPEALEAKLQGEMLYLRLMKRAILLWSPTLAVPASSSSTVRVALIWARRKIRSMARRLMKLWPGLSAAVRNWRRLSRGKTKHRRWRRTTVRARRSWRRLMARIVFWRMGLVSLCR